MSSRIRALSTTIATAGVFCLVLGTTALAQTAGAPRQQPLKEKTAGKVTAVHTTAAPATYSGVCSQNGKRVVFHGTITASGPVDVKYTWVRSDGGVDTTPHEVKFTAAGTKQVSHYWDLTETSKGWEALQVTAPSKITSAHAVFNVTCVAKNTKTLAPKAGMQAR